MWLFSAQLAVVEQKAWSVFWIVKVVGPVCCQCSAVALHSAAPNSLDQHFACSPQRLLCFEWPQSNVCLHLTAAGKTELTGMQRWQQRLLFDLSPSVSNPSHSGAKTWQRRHVTLHTHVPFLSAWRLWVLMQSKECVYCLNTLVRLAPSWPFLFKVNDSFPCLTRIVPYKTFFGSCVGLIVFPLQNFKTYTVAAKNPNREIHFLDFPSLWLLFKLRLGIVLFWWFFSKFTWNDFIASF